MSYKNKDWREYIPWVDRCEWWLYKTTHLYDWTFDEPWNPMCKYWYNRLDWLMMSKEEKWKWNSYSIFRNNVSNKWICKTCKKRADLWLNGIECKE